MKTAREVANSSFYLEKIKANWQVRNTRKLDVGPTATTLIQVRGGLAAEINHFHVELYDVENDTHFVVALVPQRPVWTFRKLPVDGVVKVRACEGLRDIVPLGEAVFIEPFVHKIEPNDWYHWFAWAGRRLGHEIASTQALGIAIVATKPCRAICTVSGN
jgi:hypothetical protein